MIDIVSRMSTETESFYALTWENLSLRKLLDTKMPKVFKDLEDEKTNEFGGLPFHGYLASVFDCIKQ